MTDSAIPRTVWAERHVESFIAPTFVAEFVFRSPQMIDGTQKEVADFLVHRADQALLISQKCQQDPTTRSGDGLQRWANKKAGEAATQLKGALRRIGEPIEIWCDHQRRGRVLFDRGLPRVDHAVATVEVFEHVDLQGALPLELLGTPLTYLSVSDFINVCLNLRTVPEVLRYLEARRRLPPAVLQTLGSEQVIFGHYLFHDGDFSAFTSLEDTVALLASKRNEFRAVVDAKREQDAHAHLLEHVADQLAGRHPRYQDGLTQAVLAHYEPTGQRAEYLVMQDLIAGVTLGERAALGEAFERAISLRNGEPGLTHVQLMVSSHTDYVFVLGSFGETARASRNDLLASFHPLANAAMAHYGKKRCLIIFDRDGQSYEVGHGVLTGELAAVDFANGERIFGHLRMSTRDLHLRPA